MGLLSDNAITELVQWAINKFSLSKHSHETSDVTGLNEALSGKAAANHNHTKSQITDFPLIPTKTSQLENDSGFIKEGSGTQITVDSALSATSTNPVQNKVVKAALDGKADSTHTHNYAGASSAGGSATSAEKLTTTRTIDGINFNGSADIKRYATCSTAAGTAEKTVSCTGFVLKAGAMIAVRFANTNTATSPTLNVNNTGAKAIRYRDVIISADVLAAGRTYLFIYNGASYELVGDLDTVYTHPTTAGNKHIPAGGSSGQILKWSADGTAVWDSFDGVSVICGTFTGNGSTQTVNIGAEPKAVFIEANKTASSIDSMNTMFAHTNASFTNTNGAALLTIATNGFTVGNVANTTGKTYFYVALV